MERIRNAIASERFLEIVAARRCDVTLSYEPNDLDVLNRLMTEPKCARYHFRRAGSDFVGASPELLFLKSGLELRTQALAGNGAHLEHAIAHSATCSTAGMAPRMDPEHEFVVAAIRNALAPLCDEVVVARDPEVLKLRNILHINTPFEARVRPTTHVTELLEALHPTPAVGGVPGRAAQEWNVEHESHKRGWYTGPVGWFDDRGDAEFRRYSLWRAGRDPGPSLHGCRCRARFKSSSRVCGNGARRAARCCARSASNVTKVVPAGMLATPMTSRYNPRVRRDDHEATP